MFSVGFAKTLMKVRQRAPRFDVERVGELSEVFWHDSFLSASEERKRQIMCLSSQAKYDSETAYPWDAYFGMDLRPLLEGKRVLDLGCFTGGRSAAWFDRYALAHIAGIDVAPVFIDAARQYSEQRGMSSEFKVGFGEAIPFEDDSFDAILSFDVFEHVQDVKKTLEECRRVLAPGGLLFVVFPGYFHPTEHHLGLATGIPCLHWLFGGRTLLQAYHEILMERGVDAQWYRRESPEPREWERGHTINGTTVSAFRGLVATDSWKVRHRSTLPVGAVGRRATRSAIAGATAKLLAPLARIPLLEEFILHRIAFILEKRP